MYQKHGPMDYGKKTVRMVARCLECGDQIRYGRVDKKFCCEDCRVTHYNRQSRSSRAFRRRVLGILVKNYDILEGLFRAGTSSIGITDIMAMGFIPGMVTSYGRVGKHDEFTCFDIKYRMTPSRLSHISKIQNVSLPLQAGMMFQE